MSSKKTAKRKWNKENFPEIQVSRSRKPIASRKISEKDPCQTKTKEESLNVLERK